MADAHAQVIDGERRLDLAGLRIRIRFAGVRLAAILDPAFGHLVVDDDRIDDLVITAIDGETRAAPSSFTVDYGDGALGLHEYEHGRCAHWFRDVATMPAWAAASPLRAVLGRFLATRDRFLVHGAAIGRASGAVLVAAKGGSGKSTSALACLESGTLSIAGDDFVVLESPRRVAALYGIAKVARAHAARFPGLADRIVRGGGPLDDPAEKAVVRIAPERLAATLPIDAIVIPTLDLARTESRIEPATRGDALLAVAPSSIFLVPGAGGETFAALSALCAGLPAYRLRIGSDVRGIPRAIEGLLESLRG